MIQFGLSPATSKILLERVFIVVALVLLLLGCYVIFKQNKQIEGILLFLFGIAAIFYYWIKFFKVKSEKGVWPPVINSCPDYLSEVSPSVTGYTQTVCMDFVGVAVPSQSRLVQADPTNIPKSTDSDFMNKSFIVPKSTDEEEDMTTTICNQVRARGLTWAHICDV